MAFILIELQEHGGFIAVGVLGAMHAVGPDLLGQDALVHLMETDALKESRLIRQGEDLLEVQDAMNGSGSR